jgi:hypothetical protein
MIHRASIQPLFSAAALRLALAAVLALGLGVSFATAGEKSEPEAHVDGPACENDVWLVSIRQWNHCCEPVRISFWRLQGCCFAPSHEEEFLATDVPGRPTCFWIHGWRLSHGDAISAGLRVYQRMACRTCQPFRLVIWSWPSEPTMIFRQDACHKAQLSDAGAYPLALLIDRIDPGVPVSLVGFSLGARMSAGALHLLGGGQLAGWQLAHRLHAERAPLRAVLFAGALDNFSLATGQRNCEALGQVERMLVMVNCRDSVLKWYPWLCSWNGPQAISHTGAMGNLGPYHRQLRQMCVDHIIGHRHEQEPYFESPVLLSAIVNVALFCDVVQPSVSRRKRSSVGAIPLD